MEATVSTGDSNHQYSLLDSYDWDNDQEFQGGLRTILASATSPAQLAHLTLRARCYYFARKYKTKIDFEGYREWTQAQTNTQAGPSEPNVIVEPPKSSQRPPTPQESSSQLPDPAGDAPHPASFADICELIAAGKPIPGIKDIPDTVLEGQATQSRAAARKKPWEKDSAAAPTPSWARPT